MIDSFFAFRTSGAHCVHGEKILIRKHLPGMFQGKFGWKVFFWNSTPQWAEIAKNWPRVKITADDIVHFPPIEKWFALIVGQKWWWIHILSNLWGGVQPRLAVILVSITFVKFPLWDPSSLDIWVWTALEVLFRTVWTWGTLNLVIWVFKNLKSDHFWRFYDL